MRENLHTSGAAPGCALSKARFDLSPAVLHWTYCVPLDVIMAATVAHTLRHRKSWVKNWQ
jgi:hypothetical protein